MIMTVMECNWAANQIIIIKLHYIEEDQITSY